MAPLSTDIIQNMQAGFQTAFIDYRQDNGSNLAYRPEFISNDYEQGKKVLSTIEEELRECKSFDISVAFITLGGITPLLQILQELETKGIPGRILTTDYLTFSDPKALEKLAELKNLTIKMYVTEPADGTKVPGFHTKGYIFEREELYHILIGSSNMTLNAFTVNREWNTKLVCGLDGEVTRNIRSEFEQLWESQHSYAYQDFIQDYSRKYKIIQDQQRIAREQTPIDFEAYKLQPNRMQLGFIANLQALEAQGAGRALLISSCGSGKTYASAFAMRETDSGKILFIVHRETIARQALASYQKVFGKTKSYGLLSGSSRDYDADILFSTMQMMAKPETLARFQPDAFQTIIIDEVHKAGAESYQRIIDYFKPQLYLGMTATPERTDHYDIYGLFDHNIAYEIRLQQALEDDLLCPFHYFGITDLTINDEVIGDADHEDGLSSFNRLTADARVDYVIKQAAYYGYSGSRVKGLIFVSRKQEGKELSEKFNARGYRTAFLDGASNQEKREEMIRRLEQEPDDANALDYIFTVDIFNEGVDIPSVNQVIMLRPTQSPIIFVQQLGRGLRKYAGKEYVVVLDFIGNYTNNFMIPIALSGDRTYNKDNIRKYVIEGSRVIPGCSTVHFDEISRKRIFAAIDAADFNDLKLIKSNYLQLKNKLGRIPALKDFDLYGEMDVCRIFANNSLGSYYAFLKKYEPEYHVRLSAAQEQVIKFISKKLASGKRVYELELLKRILGYQKHGLMRLLSETMQADYGIQVDQDAKENIVNVMTNEFPSGTGKETFKECVFLEPEAGDYKVSETFSQMLSNPDFRDILNELVDFGIARYQENFSNRYKNTDLVLYQKYTYEDVCRLLCWEKNEVPININGYKFDQKTKTLPVFINYEKADDIAATTKYEDRFVNQDTLIAISKARRKLGSKDVMNFLHAKERGIDVELFVRKNKDDKISNEFYYLGQMTAVGDGKQFVMPGTDKTAVEIEWKLDTPVREDVYQYIVG